ncbi:MAG: hypothetical protein FE048_00090 [Thermoplasmata archaeon]|nr:MAG: hypothetical protein FE048_00090 [Thermoplasmata archaeon]
MKKIGLYFLAILAIGILLSTVASAGTITDETNDVWHWTWNAGLGRFSWTHSVTSKPNIDITELSYTIEGGQAILKMKVKGTIENSEKVMYIAYYNTTDANYWMTYTNGTGMCMAMSPSGGTWAWGNVTASGDTITAVVNLVGIGTEEEFWGYAVEYTQIKDTSAEYWGDWAPQDTSPWYEGDGGEGDGGDGGEDGGGGGGIPGFESAILCMSILIAIAIWRKRR